MVAWTSQAAGVSKDKVGRVVVVVPDGGNAIGALQNHLGRKPPQYVLDWGMCREGVSYVVKVGSRYYWPKAEYLKLYVGEDQCVVSPKAIEETEA